jgi:FG-GAP-like repeat/ASPIC and UnbV
MRLAAWALAAGVLGAVAALPAQAPAPPSVQPSAGTLEMAALLEARAKAVGPADLWFNVNDRRAEAFAAALARRGGGADLVDLRTNLAKELLFAGRYADSVAQVDGLLTDVRAIGQLEALFAEVELLMLQATTLMRWGEEQNCVLGHNRDSCLLPIKGQGVHTRRDGSTRAIATLERVLKLDPSNLRARWLLNIAHMTLGSYPDGVPARFLIPPAAFTAAHPLPAFENVAGAVGLDIYGLSGGAVLEDLDEDGLLDVMVTAIGFTDQMRVFRNAGGRFTDATAASGLTGLTGGLNMVTADYDNDGLLDVLVLRGAWMGAAGQFPMSLLRNRGGLRFDDVTKAAGLLRLRPSQTATWLDVDGDGFLDLFVGNESGGPAINPCELYRNNRDGTFTEIAKASGVDVVAFVKAVVSGDYDNDGDPDIFVSVAQGANLLFRNDGPGPRGSTGWRFTNVTAQAGVELPKNSFPAMFFDYDDDGWLDLFVAPYWGSAEDVAADYLGIETSVERGKLYRNKGDGTFADVTREAGLHTVMQVMGLNYGDLDNDGWLDFYAGTGNPDFHTLVPNRMFRNDGGKRFQDVTTAGNFGHLQKGHGIAWGDVDNDGDLDVFEQMGGAYQADRAYSALYENPRATPSDNAARADWVSLELEGTTANRAAIGARVTVRLETPAGPRRIHRVVSSGGSFGASTLRVFVGLGDATRIAGVEVAWPLAGKGAAATQTFTGLEPARHYLLKQGAPAPTLLTRPVTPLSRSAAPHAHQQ